MLFALSRPHSAARRALPSPQPACIDAAAAIHRSVPAARRQSAERSMLRWGICRRHRPGASPPSLSGPRSSRTMTSRLSCDLVRCTGLRHLVSSVPSRAAFSTSSAQAPAQDGVWAGAGGCFLIRGVQFPRKLITGRQRSGTHSPQPRPRGDIYGRVRCRSLSNVWTITPQPSDGSPCPSAKSCAARQPACVPVPLLPYRALDAWRGVLPTISERTTRRCGG